ncbi:acetyltransferase-like isoleucine patch superfamily enzyme [Chitinophaga niastensis]|uniref:Acetyltransferase-like isoleucine patch superfamily enzyme n=1 Tax=Chitinophaga niastensis TaxID=536980 RepID=A0A2P8HRU1_CHINA|nr:acyltransferase [Chitinophaga niastensis]PSL48941.1 acetyltransferase-like isoleucine patch superfamily enzyme [Chitinophaga niastensis]
MFVKELRNRLKFWRDADRIGPDIPGTHWKLHFQSTMLKLCKRKFLYFADTALFRPGAYAVGCSKISIGKRVVIRPCSHLHGASANLDVSITIEDDVLIGSGVHIYVTNHNFDNPDIPIYDQGHHLSRPVTLKKGCWIGANAIILPGVTIGENSVVGAGSVVTKSIPDRVVAAGSPAKVIKWLGSADNQPSGNHDTKIK